MRKYATNTRTEFSHILNNTSMFSAKYVSAGVYIQSMPQVSCESFLSAARTRYKRGQTRQQALVHMKEWLSNAPHL